MGGLTLSRKTLNERKQNGIGFYLVVERKPS